MQGKNIYSVRSKLQLARSYLLMNTTNQFTSQTHFTRLETTLTKQNIQMYSDTENKKVRKIWREKKRRDDRS